MYNNLKQHIINCINQNIRFDGRKNDEHRKITIEYDISKNAEGSARVKIGNTEVIVGIKTEVGSPYPDTPDEGTIMVGAELYPLSNPDFEGGPPSTQAVELARVIDRGIRESKAIDFKKLCIKEGEKVWLLLIDICVINDEGNLFDASSLAALAALKNMHFPEIDGENIDYKKKSKQGLKLNEEPLSVTVHKIGGNYIIDPSNEEEEFIDARLTAAATADGTICALQKGGDDVLTEEDVDNMITLAVKKTKELRKYL
ncbi:RNA-binding protein [Candidatus Woesearchaeota archaeon]|nr:RNA-binding protein [Candidatus Woesearchaeota archaeon]|tara:strand:- start:16447 stop:17217 length:771 start_codon:yes stop_codon:yes gene_type:complete